MKHLWTKGRRVQNTCAQTHIDVSLLVSEEQVVQDGAVVEVLQRGHVLHPPGAALVHHLYLLPGQRGLLVPEHLQHNTHR